ncbi:ABC transporter permease [Paraflavitalea soli]|uniref:ABC transporter permease n=1 Tax=Paraflavitalea soli TaxID=2315862 RepID=A0A3B7MKJ0_9BACT|nr:ABC transporter permease [Paraflavitalea soli]AXY73779.1 ABC transporter permease [Paraflavitalea soli]
MFSYFIKTTLRNLWRNKTYSTLNILGLAIGIACAGLIFLWMEDEVNYDQVNVKKDRIYRLLENQTYDGKVRTFWSTPGPLAEAIKAEIPGIDNTCRVSGSKPTLFSLGDKAIYERGGYADQSIFSLFTWQFVQGNAKEAFNQLYSVVISEKMAEQFFGKSVNAIGKTIRFDNKQDYVVSGVVKDLPANSTLQMDWIAPFEIFFKENTERLTAWGNNSLSTYVELSPQADIAKVNQLLAGSIKKRLPETSTTPFLFSMNDWRLRDQYEDGRQAGGRIQFVRMFTIIAWIILFIACINFMNLSTARSEKRAREVGVRKVLGAGKRRLIIRFIGESILMALLAVIIGLIIIAMALPAFNVLVEKQLTPGLDNPLHLGALLIIALLCGLVAGSYPALYLSSFNPVFVFKGIRIKGGSASFIRKGLVVTQFTVSIVLIISTIIIYQQVQHVKNRDIGYDRNNLLALDVRGNMAKNFSVIKDDLVKTGAVENAALNSYNVMDIGNNSSNFTWQGKDPNASILVSARGVSPEFIATTGMKIAEGRDFQSNAIGDSANILITETFAKMLGEGSAVGKTVTFLSSGDAMHVVGVVKDFIYGDMYAKSDPVMFFLNNDIARTLYIRLRSNSNVEASVAKIGTVMKKDNPGYPFEYKFVDDQFNDRFKSEALIGKLSRVFAVLAIIISCLGLFGLAAYTAERRTREIGIRKVLGASVTGITHLLSKEFLQLVLLSALISFPLAWWAMDQWLQSYSYRVSIQWWVFLVAGGLAMLIALMTISLQSIKAALMNPVKSLRSE